MQSNNKDVEEMLIEDFVPPTRPKSRERKLTEKQKELIELIVIHKKAPYQAYMMVYPKSQQQGKKVATRRVNEILSKPLAMDYYKKVVKANDENMVNKAIWNREDSILGLRQLYDMGVDELIRIETAFQLELEHLNDKLADAVKLGDTKLIAEYHNNIIRLMKSKRISTNGMSAVKDAISELNKISGFNSETVNSNQVISFTGEDKMLE